MFLIFEQIIIPVQNIQVILLSFVSGGKFLICQEAPVLQFHGNGIFQRRENKNKRMFSFS